MTETYDELQTEIRELEQTLAMKKKEYRELKTAGLRAGMDARNEAEKAVRDELRNLGYSGYAWTNRFTL